MPCSLGPLSTAAVYTHMEEDRGLKNLLCVPGSVRLLLNVSFLSSSRSLTEIKKKKKSCAAVAVASSSFPSNVPGLLSRFLPGTWEVIQTGSWTLSSRTLRPQCAPPRSLFSPVSVRTCSFTSWEPARLERRMIAGSCSEVKPGCCSCSCCWFTVHLVVECYKLYYQLCVSKGVNGTEVRGSQWVGFRLLETGCVSMCHFGASATLFTRRFFYVCVRVWHRLCRAEG